MKPFPSINSLARFARFFRDLREERRTARLIAELPASIRKDIGWPEGYPGRLRTRT